MATKSRLMPPNFLRSHRCFSHHPPKSTPLIRTSKPAYHPTFLFLEPRSATLEAEQDPLKIAAIVQV